MLSHILTVTQLTGHIKSLLEGSFPDVWVEGELSNLNIPQSGHAYFTLKDEQSQIRGVLFRSAQRHLKFTLQHGMLVVCRGRVGVYEPRGEYQLIVEYLEPKGIGALQRAYEELKARLEQEGLFAQERKRPLPLLPKRIGIITSPTGAAIRDILRVIKRRHPRMSLLLYPVPVQGADAAPAIIEAIEYFNRQKNVDVVIAGRGGGSLEDLWAFNEESVARAIAGSRIPIISAVGHETDYTISDFAADLRAPTPSAAAEMVVQSEDHFRERMRTLETGLVRSIRTQLERLRSSIREQLRVLVDPRKKIEQFNQRLDELTVRLANGFKRRVQRDRALLTALASALDHLNPLNVLARGYSITRKLPEGSIVMSCEAVLPGDRISTRVQNGTFLARVEEISGE